MNYLQADLVLVNVVVIESMNPIAELFLNEGENQVALLDFVAAVVAVLVRGHFPADYCKYICLCHGL